MGPAYKCPRPGRRASGNDSPLWVVESSLESVLDPVQHQQCLPFHALPWDCLRARGPHCDDGAASVRLASPSNKSRGKACVNEAGEHDSRIHSTQHGCVLFSRWNEKQHCTPHAFKWRAGAQDNATTTLRRNRDSIEEEHGGRDQDEREDKKREKPMKQVADPAFASGDPLCEIMGTHAAGRTLKHACLQTSPKAQHALRFRLSGGIQKSQDFLHFAAPVVVACSSSTNHMVGIHGCMSRGQRVA